MGNFNVDELPDLNEKNSKPKAFNVDELPDFKKKDEPNLKSGSNASSSSNTTSKSESGFFNGKNTTSQAKPVNNMPIEQINDIGNIFQKPTDKKQDIPIPFDAKKAQPTTGTKLPVPEKVDYAVNKEGKDIQGVEWGAFKEYEVSQRALSEVDKKLAGTNTQTIHINSIGAFTSPIDNKKFEQELSKRKEQLTQERNPLKIKADAVLEVTNNQVEKIIDVAKNKYGLEHFSKINNDGEKVADPTKVEAWAKSIVKKAGLPEDSYAERLLYNQMKAQVDFKPVAEKIDQEVKTIYKSKYGKSFDDLIGDDQKKYFSQFKEGKEIEERFKLQQKSVLEQTVVPRDEQSKQLGELYKKSAESLNTEFETLHSQQSQKAEIAKSLYEKGTLPYETANQQINEAIREQKSLEADFSKKLEAITTEYLTNNSYINAKYNKQAKRMIDELAKSADREYRKVAEKYAQGYKIPDSLKKEYESVYKQAYSKVTKSEDERLYEKDKWKMLNPISSLYAQHLMHGLGGAVKAFSTSLGLRGGEILGDIIQSRRSFSNTEIKDATDFFNPVKFVGSSSETMGGMIPMIGGQATLAALTGGMSIPAQMALQGVFGVVTEGLQSAGANKDQIFAQTGSVTEANKAFNKTMTGYLALFPLAAIDGLPFIEKATLGIKSWAKRAGAKSLIETGTETVQETMQNKVDSIATDINQQDLKSMLDVSLKDFYQSGLNVAPSTLIMGGAPTVFNQGIKEYRTVMGKAYATKNMLADVSGSAREQFIHGLVTNRGSDFTKAYATALFNNGEISGIELDRLWDNIKTAEQINKNAEALGLTKPQAKVYAAMQFDLENSKRDAFKMDYTDNAIKTAHEQIINEKQKRLNDFLATKKGDYVVVTNADFSQQVLTLDEFDKLAENPEFIKALAGGDVQAFIETDKKGKESKILSDSINAKIKEQNTAKPSTNQQTPTELTVGLSDKEGNKITRISEDGNDIFVQDKDGNIKTYTKDEADKIFGTELLPNPIVNQNQVQNSKEQKAEGQENVLTGTDQKVEPQVQEDKTNAPALLESLTAEQKKEVAKDVEAKVLKQKAIDGTLDEYLLGLYNEKIQKENENKGTPVEPIDTGQKQDNGTGVQQAQQDDKSVQQGSGTGQNMSDQKEVSGQVQAKEVTNPALKDVESTAKALEGIDESQLPEVIDEESYLAKNGAPFMGGAEPALHKNIQEGRAKQQMIKRVSDEMNKNNQKREELRKEYEQKVKEGKILPPNRNDKLIASANSNPDLESTQAARRLLEKKGIDWQIGKTKPQSISEAYHKAKADGTNPELVKAVEDLLGKAPTQYTEAATPKDDSAIQSGGEQNMPDQKEISVGKQKEEQVKPIRQLGTGANVYFETKKYRVNDSRNGKVYLNIGNEFDEVPLRTVEFDNANEAVFVAKKLEEYRPDGLTNEYNVDAIIETLKSEYNNQGTPTEVNQPVQQDASTADKQGNKESVQQGADATGQGNAEGKTAVLDIEKVQNKLNNNVPLNGEEIIIAEQNKLTPQNLDNNIKLAEDENEQQLAESKLTEQDNIEQEPNVKAIESKANSNNEVELNEAVKKADELINASTDVVNVPISEISVNTEEYQGRKKQFSERSANKVHKFFDKNKFDPIVVYRHPNGKTYVLSGHSRFEGMKRRGETTIPARVFEGTPEQAKEFALTSNKNNDLQTDLENAAYYREQLNNGKSYNAVLEEAKANEQQGSAKKIVSMAHLNPDGKTMKALERLENTEGDSNTNLVNIATKIGDIRAKNPHLTDAHENELFEYMTQDKDNIPTDKELADQNSQINRSINSVRFDNKEPLNLQKFTNKSDARLAWEAEKKDLESQVAELKKEVNPSKKTGWTGLKEKAIASIAKGNTKEQLDQAERDFENDINGIKSNYQRLLEKKRAELTAVSNKLAKHLLSEKNLIEGEKNQGSLFSAGTKPNTKTISKKAFDKLIERLKKAFSNVMVFQDENTLKSKLKEFGVDIAQFLANAIEITDKIQFLRTKDGTIFGAKFPDGSIYINPNELNANTPIHEFGHIWEQAFGARFKAGVEILKQSAKGRALIEQVRKNPFYKNMTTEQIEREALVVAIGNKGEQLFGASNYEKLKQWISDLFKAIKEKLGFKQNLTADETLENFTKGVVGELLGGKVLNEEIGRGNKQGKGVRFMTLPDGRKVSVRDMGVDVVNGFYSNTEYALAQVKDNKMSGNKWKQRLLSIGAKSDEMQWTGLDKFLSDNADKSVTKADIEQFMKDNRIQVVEVVNSGKSEKYYQLVEEQKNASRELDILESDLGNWSDENYKESRDKKYELNDKIKELSNQIKEEESKTKDTKFENYQLEGEKSNYKEILVTLPSRGNLKERWGVFDNKGKLVSSYNSELKAKQKSESIGGTYKMASNVGEADPKVNFKSTHFEEPNILVHLRMNTRTDAEGNKVLFLEEIQSDWAQTGKKEGFKSNERDSRVKELVNKRDDGTITEKERQELGNLISESYKAETPTAPFVTDTNAWTKLGLKVALKEAVKQGADKIAWTTGEQQNDRYDLSKQVDKIDVEAVEDVDGLFFVDIKLSNGNIENLEVENGIIREGNYKGQRLDNVIGKDYADKILSTPKGESKTLEGADLKVGGKGMKGFYGSPTEGSLGIVGNVAKSLFKQEPKTTKILTNTAKLDKTFLVENRPNEPMGRTWLVIDEEGSIRGRHKTESEAEDDAQRLYDGLFEIQKRSYSTQHSIDITPELKAQVQEGLPLFKFDSNTINDDVREMKSAGLSEDRIREVLSLSGNTQEEIDKALYDTQNLDSDKQRVADRFVKGDSGFEQAKQMVIDNGYDKGEYDSKQIFDDIDNLIEKSGTDNIEKLLDLPLSEPHRVVLQHRIFEHFGKQSIDETLSEQERKDAFEKSARYLLDLSRQRTEAGRGNAILHQIYLDSDIYFTLPMAQKKMDALGTILSDSEMAEMKEMAQEIERLRKENKDLQELAQKEQDDKIVDDIKNNLLVDELILDSNTKDEVEVKNAKQRLGRNFQKIAEKFGAIKMLDATEKTDFFQILHEMTKDLMTISKIGAKKALKSVIKSVKNQHPNIDNALLDEAKQYVLSQENEETDIEDSKGNKISKGDLLELIEEGANTMDKLIVAIRDKFHGGDVSVTDKQIRDAITGYGNSMKKDRTTVEKKLSEIKAIMLLQSKLEDALNNIHPKKTGVIREKDTIDVIRLRRQLSEAMKKLKGDMSESEIAGLNERKLTYLGNRIKEVQDVIDGITTKVDEKAPFEYSQAVKDKQKELDRLMKDQRVLLHYTKEKLTNLVAKYQEKIDKKIYSKEPTLSKLIITDNEHERLKNKLKDKKKQLENARDNFRNNNSDYLLNQAQKSIEKQISRIDELIKGISKRKTSEQIKAEKLRKQGIIDQNSNETAVKRLKANQTLLENKKEEWERMLIKKQLEAEMANKSALQRIAGKLIGELVSLSRTSTLGLIDIGWIGVQGGYFLRTKPKTFAKALNEAYKNGDLDEKSFRDWIKKLKEVPMYEIMLKVGLRIPNQSLKQEVFEQEYRQSKFTDFLDKVPVANLVNKNGRLSVKFLAHLRMETFVDLYNKLSDEQKQDAKTLEKLADFVNVHTGAGGIIGENKSGSLNKWWGVLTSARNTSSMLQQTYLGMIYQGAKNFDSKRGMLDQPILFQQIKHDIFNQMVLFGTLFLAKYIAKYIDKDDDDDDWKIEMNPFSTDYMSLKAHGNKYFDMGGTTSLNVATLRLATMIMNIFGTDIDNYKTKDGVSQIGGSKWNDQTGSDILINATVSRFVPFLSFIKNPLQAKKKDGNYYLFGKEYTPNQFRLKMLTDMFKPINLNVGISDYSNKQQSKISMILNFLIGALGTGVQPVSEKNAGKASNSKGYENPYKNNYKNNYKSDY